MYSYIPCKNYRSGTAARLLRWLLLCAILSLGVVSTEALAQGTIMGTKFSDNNGNGAREIGEAVLPNWLICAYHPATNTLLTTLTNSLGQYTFSGLGNGRWLIYEDQLAGWTQTMPTSVFYTENVLPGSMAIGRDFGNAWICSNPSSFMVQAGFTDNFAAPIEPSSASLGLRTFLLSNFTWPVNEFFDYRGTNYSFAHTFTNLLADNPGCYITGVKLEIKLGALSSGNPMNDVLGFVQNGQEVWSKPISALVGSTWTFGSQTTLILDLAYLPAAASGITNILAALRDGDLDMFVHRNTSVDYVKLHIEYCCDADGTNGGTEEVHGTKYNDLNGNGVRDAGEPGLSGWTIGAYQNPTGQTTTATTDANGDYVLYLPIGGEWVVYEQQQSGWTQTEPMTVVHLVLPNYPTIVTGFDFGNTVVCADPETSTVMVGINDNFDPNNGGEETSPSPAFEVYMNKAYSYKNTSQLDDSDNDRVIGHTFTGFLPEGCLVIGARLTLKLRSNGGGSGNDLIAICGDEVNSWWGFISDIVGYPWTGSTTIVLDLANLPGIAMTNVLGALQDGDFDFFIQDDTGIDYAMLEVDYCCSEDSTEEGATLQGTKYNDLNGNGMRDSGEPALSGWVIQAYQYPLGNTTSATTDASGNYTLSLPVTGTWVVYEQQQSGWTQTAPSTVVHVVTTATGSVITGLDFGNIAVCSNPQTSSVTVGVNDNFNTGNGAEYTSPSSGLANYMNQAYPSGSTNLLDDVGTDRAIGHTFTGFLPPGCIVTGARLTMRIRANGGSSDNDLIAICADEVNTWSGYISDIVGYSWTSGSVAVVTLDLANLPGTALTNVLGALQDGDFDFFMQDDTGIDYVTLEVDYCCSGSSIQGMKFNDLNGNGMKESGESGLAGWMIEAYNPATGQMFTTVTDASGNYTFTGLSVGNWMIYERQQAGWSQTYPQSVFHSISVTGSVNTIGVDFGNKQNCTLPISTTYGLGVQDNFMNGTESANPAPSLVSFLGTLGVPMVAEYDFSPPSMNSSFGETITNLVLPGCTIVGARLNIHLSPTTTPGTNPMDDMIGFVQNGQEIWRQNIGTLAGIPWVSGSQVTLILDLANLPVPLNGSNVTNILAALQDGTLDIFVLDNTMVDYMEISVEYCCTTGPMLTPVEEAVEESGHSMTYASPNPFGESTGLTFTLPVAAPTRVTIYDVYGTTVRSFDLGERNSGTHTVRWDGRETSGAPAANGVYLYQVETPAFRYTGKVILRR
jgi:hypothetical protein